MKKQNKGITLIALVITVIVLLILAGITINLTIGQDGILKRAEEAGKNYVEAAENEKTQLDEFLNETDNIIANVTSGGTGNKEPEVPKEWSNVYATTQKDNYTDKAGKKATIPAGYQVSLKTGQTEIETGLVIRNATDKNEFVWVPCTIDGANGSIKYDRYSFGSFSNSGYSETMPSDEQTSVNTYGGYYIGRYESGVAGFDTEVSKTNSGNLEEWTGYTNGTLVIKANQQVWNYITRDKAKSVSEGLYKKSNGDSVNSKLCSSYAWDTALKFIETKYSTYPTNSEQGNYENKYGSPAQTGLTTAVNNIFDMGGNTWEWTTETYFSNDSYACTTRGGYYDGSSTLYPAAYRSLNTRTVAYVYLSFRTTLYL